MTGAWIALRHYFIGVVVGVGLMAMIDDLVVGLVLTTLGIVAQCVMQWRAGNADLSERAS